MKTVYFVRHAKSSWDSGASRDKDRPLNSRGSRDAPFMAKLLKGNGIQVDAIISSTANRAFTTATYFAEEFGINKEDIIAKDEIYEAFEEDVLQVVWGLEDRFQTVLIFGHNPTLTGLANRFSEEYIPNVPTCGIVKIESSVTKWSALNPENARMTAFHYPKKYFA